MKIRPYNDKDRDNCYRICLETGDSGKDGSHLYKDPLILGHLYIGPYIQLRPNFALSLVNDADECVGYCVAAPDTLDFVQDLQEHWFPEILASYDEAKVSQLGPRDLEIYREMKNYSYDFPSELSAYPAHMHIDLLPVGQGGGFGKKLIQSLCELLHAKGTSGLHLIVGSSNHNAIAFYKHLGFKQISGNAGRKAEDCLVLGLAL